MLALLALCALAHAAASGACAPSVPVAQLALVRAGNLHPSVLLLSDMPKCARCSATHSRPRRPLRTPRRRASTDAAAARAALGASVATATTSAQALDASESARVLRVAAKNSALEARADALGEQLGAERGEAARLREEARACARIAEAAERARAQLARDLEEDTLKAPTTKLEQQLQSLVGL
jgi:hypothetical protein